MMKKITLLASFLCLWAVAVFAQKGNVSAVMSNRLVARAQAMVNQHSKTPQQVSASRSAAYLLDSTRYVRIEDIDSIVVNYSKFKYLPDGKIKEVEVFVDSLLLAYGIKVVAYWDLAKSRAVRNDIYIKADIDAAYALSRVDSLFYDAKNNNNNTRSYSVDLATKKLTLMGWKKMIFNTNHVEADSIKTFELDGAIVMQTSLEFNGFDAKGNIIENYSLDLIDVAGAGKHTYYKFDSKNNLVEALYSDDLQSGKWINTSLDTYKYNSKNLASDHYNYSTWNNEKKTWRDSTLTRMVYNNFDKPLTINDLIFDAGTGKWSIIEGTTESFYDKNNHEAIDNVYTYDAGVKVLAGQNRYWWSLYKDAISTKDIFPKGYDLTFANPIENGKTITVIAPNNQTMNLDIFDTTGKVISSQQVENQQTVTININITGNFIAVLSDVNAKLLAVKRMVKN
jgi:hypothetical protein